MGCKIINYMSSRASMAHLNIAQPNFLAGPSGSYKVTSAKILYAFGIGDVGWGYVNGTKGVARQQSSFINSK